MKNKYTKKQLDELHENIRRAVRKSVIVFEGD